MFLLGQHKNSKNQFGRQNRLDKNSSHKRSIIRQRRPDIEFRRKQTERHGRRGDTASDLSEEETDGTGDGEGAGENHAERDGRVEEPAGDAEEDPHVDHEGEAEDERDVEVHGDVEAGGATGGRVAGGHGGDVGYLGAGEGEEEEHGCAYEFAKGGYEIWWFRVSIDENGFR